MTILTDKAQSWLNARLSRLLTGKSLSRADARKLFQMFFSGQLSTPKAKTFLLLMAKKGETADELLGCLQALQELEKPIGPKINGLMDTCGTGGDSSHTINISTLVALVLAGAGAKIAKHGNRAISSRSGSSDLMEALGVRLDAGAGKMIKAIRSLGLGYFHAPFYHPVFAKMQNLRQALKRRTILNYLGPLVNPMRLDYQLVGVSSKRLLPIYAKVLSRLGRKAALVCHGRDGLDEISTAAPTQVAWVSPGKVRYDVVRPRRYKFQKAAMKDLRVASAGQSKVRAERILNGKEKGPARDIVVLNAAYGLVLCGKAKSIHEGIRRAAYAIDSGRAARVLEKLKIMSH